MGVIRNLLALIGLLAIIGGGYAYSQLKPMYDEYQPVITKMKDMDSAKISSMMSMMEGMDIDAMMAMMTEWDIKGMMALGKQLDPKAPEIYKGMIERLKETKNAAAATVWKYPVQEGLTVQDVEQSMKNIANEHNIKAVGMLPLSEQVKAMTGEDQRFLKIYMYCNPLTAMKMIQHSDAYSAYLPCRISLIEDKQGKLWLYALDMDLMIWGGATLPDYLHEEAVKVRAVIIDIMERAAEGDF